MLSRASAADDAPIVSAIAAVPTKILHVRVIWSSTAFGNDPVDVLGRVLDVACLAVDAILRVDLEPRPTSLLDELIDSGGAVALLGPGIIGEVDRDRDFGVLESQVDRLVLLVIGVRDEH